MAGSSFDAFGGSRLIDEDAGGADHWRHGEACNTGIPRDGVVLCNIHPAGASSSMVVTLLQGASSPTPAEINSHRAAVRLPGLSLALHLQ